MKSFVFWDIMPYSPLKAIDVSEDISPPFLGLKDKPSKTPTTRIMQVVAQFCILKHEAIYSFETSVEFQRTTQHYIPEDRNLLNSMLYLLNEEVAYS
jgi:hypothetical protein